MPQAYSRILANIFEPSEIDLILHSKNREKIVQVLLSKASLIPSIPPLLNLSTLIYVASLEHPSKRAAILDTEIKKRGLLTRIWRRPSDISKKVYSELDKIYGLTTEKLAILYSGMLYNYLAKPDPERLIDLSILVDIITKRQSLIPPSKHLLRLLADLPNLSKTTAESCFKTSIKTLTAALPPIIRDEAFFLVKIAHEKELRDLTIEDLIYSSNNTKYRTLVLLLPILVNARAKMPLLKQHLFVHLLRSSLLKDWPTTYPLYLAANFISEYPLQHLATLLNVHLLAQFHGGQIILQALSTLFPESENDPRYLLTYLSLDYTTTRYLRLILLQTAKKSKFSLRLINRVLISSDLHPRNIILGIPWELYGTLETISQRINKAFSLYSELTIRPPRRLRYLNKFITSIQHTRYTKKSLSTVEEYLETISTILESLSYGQRITSELRRFYGKIPGFFRVVNETNREYKKIARKWESHLLRNYLDYLSKKPRLFTFSSLTSFEPQGDTNNLVLIIDGLRYDDFAIRLVPKLRHIRLKPLEVRPKISLLPSITNISRYSIVSGKPLTTFYITRKTPREEDIARKNLPDADIFYGPLGTVMSRISSRAPQKQNLLVVLSELEKSMHGASEAVLAHFIEEYLDSIVELISHALSTFPEKSRKRVIICSDHGLGVFPRFYDIEHFIDELEDHHALDPHLGPTIKERYAIIPLNTPNSTYIAIDRIYKENSEYQANFWITTGDALGYKTVEFYRKKTTALTNIKAGNETLFVFPKGRQKFHRGRGAIFHGGLSPEETFSAFGIFET